MLAYLKGGFYKLPSMWFVEYRRAGYCTLWYVIIREGAQLFSMACIGRRVS